MRVLCLLTSLSRRLYRSMCECIHFHLLSAFSAETRVSAARARVGGRLSGASAHSRGRAGRTAPPGFGAHEGQMGRHPNRGARVSGKHAQRCAQAPDSSGSFVRSVSCVAHSHLSHINTCVCPLVFHSIFYTHPEPRGARAEAGRGFRRLPQEARDGARGQVQGVGETGLFSDLSIIHYS